MDDSPYEPSDEELALIVRELIRVGNRKRLDAEEVSDLIFSTVSTYEDRLEQIIVDIREGVGMDYAYGVWMMQKAGKL